MVKQPIVFVNYPLETFTPTESGALATHIFETSKAALRAGTEPWVVTRRANAAPFEWPSTTFIDFPDESALTSQLGRRILRKTTGRPYPGIWRYAERVARALRRSGLDRGTLILQNAPELASILWHRLDRPAMVHHFQNQLSAASFWRIRFGRLPIVTTAVSRFTSRWVEQNWAVDGVSTVYNGVDLAQFHPVPLPPGAPIFGFVGRTGIEKGPDLLLSAALELSCDRNDFGIQLVGSNHWDRFELDAFQQRIRGMVEKLERRSVPVVQTGHVARPDLPAAIANTQCHVVPSRWAEPFGMTSLEGMATGLPILASRTGGTPEVVGEAGFLFGRDDASGLAGLMRRMLDSPDERHDFGRRSRAQAELFTWDRVWQGFLEAAALAATRP